jgi:hypothetical protein
VSDSENYRVGGRRRLLAGLGAAVVALGLLGLVLVVSSSSSDDSTTPISSSAIRPEEPTGTLGEVSVESETLSVESEPTGASPSDEPGTDNPTTVAGGAEAGTTTVVAADPATTDSAPTAAEDQTSTLPGTAPPPPAVTPSEFEFDIDVGADDLITLVSRSDEATWTGEELDFDFVDAVLWEGAPPGGLRVTISSDQLSGNIVLPWPPDETEAGLWESEDFVELTNWTIRVALIDSVEPATGTYCIEPGQSFCLTDAR